MSDTAGKLVRLLHDLKTLTEQGRVTWSETADEDEFRVALKSGFLQISRGTSYTEEGDAVRHYVVTVLNREAKLVEELIGTEAATVELLRDLHELARRSARRGDNVIDDMLMDVESRMSHPKA